MEFQRKIYQRLLRWKGNENRKPMVIRGARQVGKSTLVNMFSKEFVHYLPVNLEKKVNKDLFETLDSVTDILDSLCLSQGIPMDGAPTLLFLDEIQESPKAIQMLRYFFEDLPHIYILAAGSLLEFAIKDVPSFPVGRVEQIVLHPMDFDEFLGALGNPTAIRQLNNIPLPKSAYMPLLDLYHKYLIIGGMPEIVKQFVKDESIVNLADIYESLIQGYKDDVEKYAKNQSEKAIIRHIMETAHAEKDRISFEGFGNSKYRSREVSEAFRTLDMARIVQLIYPSTNLEPPIIDNLKKRPRLQFLDTGLLNYQLNKQVSMLQVKDFNEFHQGKIVMHMVTQELKSKFDTPSFKPNFWVREKSNSSAEVDLVIASHDKVFPIEIKSGPKGKLRSLLQFMEQSDHPYAIRLLANQFLVEEVKTLSGKPFYLMNLPYFLGGKLPEYIDWFVANYPEKKRKSN